MVGATGKGARRWAAVAALFVLIICVLPLTIRGQDDIFSTLGTWSGGVLGGLGFVVAIVAIWLTVYLASPEKEEHNRLEAARARATEALELVAVAIQFAVVAAENGEERHVGTRWTILQASRGALEVIESCCREGLYRLAAHLDGPDLDPFDPENHVERDSVVLQLMVVQGWLAAIDGRQRALEVGADGDGLKEALEDVDLDQLLTMSIRLQRSLGGAAGEVADASSGSHVAVSPWLLRLVPD